MSACIHAVIGHKGHIGYVVIGNEFPYQPGIGVYYVQSGKGRSVIEPALAVLDGATAQTGTYILRFVHIRSWSFERTEPPGRHEFPFGAVKQVESVTLPCNAPQVAPAVLQEPVIPVGTNQVTRIDLILQGQYLTAQHISARNSGGGIKPVKPLAEFPVSGIDTPLAVLIQAGYVVLFGAYPHPAVTCLQQCGYVITLKVVLNHIYKTRIYRHTFVASEP